MCGIFGFITDREKSLSSTLLFDGTQSLVHRGPDDGGYVGWTSSGMELCDEMLVNCSLRTGLGHRRLSILDLSSKGRQPMQGWGRWIVHNGEIYNYIEVRGELEKIGYRFKSGTDTEVILAAYDVWGHQCVNKFNGMWAFAIYDSKNGELFCSRDRLGVKPFYYSFNKHGFFFSSEVQSLLMCPGVTSAVNRSVLARYLIDHLTDGSDLTIYNDIKELRGGHNLTANGRQPVKIHQYWTLPAYAEMHLSHDEVVDRFAEIFEDAVKIRLRSDVPVAICLSGGVDSSAVAVAAKKWAAVL